MQPAPKHFYSHNHFEKKCNNMTYGIVANVRLLPSVLSLMLLESAAAVKEFPAAFKLATQLGLVVLIAVDAEVGTHTDGRVEHGVAAFVRTPGTTNNS
jgi:hypothetical protein